QHVDGKFNEALHYALFPGGKRLRPVLTLLGGEIVGGSGKALMTAASAVEFVHTSSLIFDDLPCMDDARERRGQTPLHARYGEGLSVLVALALMNASYGLVFETVPLNRERAIRAHSELVDCIGATGMVAGQAIDLSAARKGRDATIKCADETMRNLKTSALIRFALRFGAILSGAGEQQLRALSLFADLLGDAYQISDDVIDLEEDAIVFHGPRAANLAVELGAESAQRRVAKLITRAKSVLIDEFGVGRETLMLNQLADYVVERKV
ncbi:MAG: polyprenyl synthetase family protein, partial [Pyrinomonadaceae bacterium]